MDPTVTLESSSVSVTPGSQAHIGMTIRNTGNRVQRFRFEVLGQAAPWTTVHPPEIPVYPDADVTVSVVLAPPSGPGAPAGNVPFGVRVVSALDDDDSMAVAQGTVDIGSVDGLQVSLRPVEASGRWSTRHKAEVANWGNVPLSLAVSAVDDNNKLGFLVSPDHVEVPVGSRQDISLRVRVREPMMRGNPIRHPFRLVVAPPSADGAGAGPGGPMSPGVAGPPGALRPGERVINGAITQKPVLTRTVVTLAVVAVAAIAAGAVLLATNNKGSSTNDVAAPASPVGFKVASPPGSDTVTAQWNPDPTVPTYRLNAVTNGAVSGNVPLSPGQTFVSLKPGPGNHCYSVEALQGDVSSNPTDPACVVTGSGKSASGKPGPPKAGGQPSGAANQAGGAPGGAGGGGNGSGGDNNSGGPSSNPSGAVVPNEWAAALYDGDDLATVAQHAQQLQAQSDRTIVIVSASQVHPLVDPTSKPEDPSLYFAVVGGGFRTRNDALTWCQGRAFSDPSACLVQVGSTIPFNTWPPVSPPPATPTSSGTP